MITMRDDIESRHVKRPESAKSTQAEEKSSETKYNPKYNIFQWILNSYEINFNNF